MPTFHCAASYGKTFLEGCGIVHLSLPVLQNRPTVQRNSATTPATPPSSMRFTAHAPNPWRIASIQAASCKFQEMVTVQHRPPTCWARGRRRPLHEVLSPEGPGSPTRWGGPIAAAYRRSLPPGSSISSAVPPNPGPFGASPRTHSPRRVTLQLPGAHHASPCCRSGPTKLLQCLLNRGWPSSRWPRLAPALGLTTQVGGEPEDAQPPQGLPAGR